MLRAITCVLLVLASQQAQAFSAAFFYGSPFARELRIYDAVIVESDHADFKIVPESLKNKLYAYTSLGEVGPDKPYAPHIPVAAIVARNSAWASTVMDQTSPAWRAFYLDKIVAPLWDRGFRGVFIDTLDSYQLASDSAPSRSLQEAGMVETLRQMRSRFPGIRIILNRGFEILPQVHDWISAVVAESLFQGWNNASASYESITESNRLWLMQQLDRVKNTYHLPVIVIDYVAPRERELAREIAKKIRAAGYSPWVSNPELNMIGVGYPEVQPRRILMLYNGSDIGDVVISSLHRYAAMPVQYLGFIPEYHDLFKPLPDAPLAGQYAGIVIWASGAPTSSSQLQPWLLKQITQGMRIAVINDFGFVRSNYNLQAFGIKTDGAIAAQNVRIVSQDGSVGFEHMPQSRDDLLELIDSGRDSQPILRLGVADKVSDVAAYMPWGGYIFSPYAQYELPSDHSLRWIINPFDFFKRALDLPDMPAPDVTTSTGRRLLMAHMDGDGFASLAEFPGSPLAPRVMLEKIFQKYRIPTAVSVIEGEIAPWGLYPEKSAEMEQIAREIFLLPHVEIASHSYSHPFRWQQLSTDSTSGEYNLPLPGYKFYLNKEISGSVNYINQNLAPPGKSCKIFLWTGDCNPGTDAIAKSDALGLLNMNGGETIITNSQPSLTDVAPLGVARGDYYQVYAPNQNENVYTNLWTGPFYGYSRVVETFKLTDSPRRLKPVDIYFHTYAASKPGSLKALDEVYAWALKQSNHPIFPSDYIRRVLDFNQSVIAHADKEWFFYGDGSIDTLRIEKKWGYPTINDGVAGYNEFNDSRYVHLAKAEVHRVPLVSQEGDTVYLFDANAKLIDWQKNNGQIKLSFNANVALEFTLHHAAHCSLYDDKKVKIRPDTHLNQLFHYKHNAIGRSSYFLTC
jgi:polysaccharide biosynthesis protein PelA